MDKNLSKKMGGENIILPLAAKKIVPSAKIPVVLKLEYRSSRAVLPATR